MIRQPPRSTHCISSAASDVYKRQTLGSDEMGLGLVDWMCNPPGFALFQWRLGKNCTYLA